jgi:hypothetical protein
VTRPVTAAERKRDRIALGLLAAGLVLYGTAFLGMRTMAEVPIVARPGHPAITHFTNLWLLSLAGIALVGIGGIAMAWSFWRYLTRRTGTP